MALVILRWVLQRLRLSHLICIRAVVNVMIPLLKQLPVDPIDCTSLEFWARRMNAHDV